VSRKKSSSSEDRSTTGILSEGSPGSNTGEGGCRDETSDGEPSGGGDPDGDGGGIELRLLGQEEPSFEGERERLVFLLPLVFHC
jgi:hypothetical protein